MRLWAIFLAFLASVQATTGDVDQALVGAVLSLTAAVLSLQPGRFGRMVSDEIAKSEQNRAD